MLQYSTVLRKGEMKSDYLMQDIYNLLDQTFRIPDDFNFQVLKVTDEYIARPDLISYDAYGNTMYADLICKLNGISNPFELNEGQRLILPDISYLSDFFIDPPTDEKEKDDVIVPVPKSKQSKKRKANEAIIGDRRFKIDKTAGIIIY